VSKEDFRLAWRINSEQYLSCGCCHGEVFQKGDQAASDVSGENSLKEPQQKSLVGVCYSPAMGEEVTFVLCIDVAVQEASGQIGIEPKLLGHFPVWWGVQTTLTSLEGRRKPKDILPNQLHLASALLFLP